MRDPARIDAALSAIDEQWRGTDLRLGQLLHQALTYADPPVHDLWALCQMEDDALLDALDQRAARVMQ